MNISASKVSWDDVSRGLASVELALKEAGFSPATPVVSFLKDQFKTHGFTFDYWIPDDPRILSTTLYNEKAFHGHKVLLNESIKTHPDASTRIMRLKSRIAHEFSHVFLKHPPAFHLVSGGDCTEQAQMIYSALMGFAKAEYIRGNLEMMADLLTITLCLWPEQTFNDVFLDHKASFRGVSDVFRVPIDCCVKWYMLRYRVVAHYMKYNVREDLIEDHFVAPASGDHYRDFGWDIPGGAVFRDSITTAHKCLIQKRDQEGTTLAKNGRSYFCKAYYIEKDDVLKMDAKIIVIGFPKEVYEGSIETALNYVQRKEAKSATKT